jgi:hypothetical protein
LFLLSQKRHALSPSTVAGGIAMPDDPRQRQPDITAAKQLLGWLPQIELREGLENTIRYFEKHLYSSSERLRSPFRDNPVFNQEIEAAG